MDIVTFPHKHVEEVDDVLVSQLLQVLYLPQ